jgi:hypothetical protein
VSTLDERLVRAKVLLELGWIPEAEVETLRVLDEAPDHLTAMSLFAKIKHIRGQLSQAIGCWAHIHARSPHNENAMMQLRALLDLSRDPERAASEFLVLGGDHVARKPAGQLELEQALALFHERRPDDARTCCAHIAARHRGRDAQLYKLAVIGGAWLAELAGDLPAARGQLEALGLERGFEHDLDRLFSLVRVYDRIGTPDTIEAAAKICRHVLRELEAKGIEKISLFHKLASLERRAGRAEAAAELDRAYLTGIRRRMHRPSLYELVRIAAADYLPLDQLRTARRTSDELPAELSRRERALVHALRDERSQARVLLADGGEPLDRRYLADLHALDGDDERAIALHIDTLADPPEDPHVMGWLIDRHPAPRVVEYLTGRAHQVLELLHRNLAIAPQRAEIWRRLSIVHALAGDHESATGSSQRAEALAHSAAARANPIGRVLAASVYHFTGKAKGLLHEIWVHRARTQPGCGGTLAAEDILGNVTPELRAAIRNTFVAVREYARARFPLQTRDLDDYTYSYKLPKEDEPSGGLSAGLPSALAFLSVFLQRPVPHGIASSGALVTEAHDVITIGRIGEADYKVKAAYHANARALILPLANKGDLERSTLVPPEITREIVQYAAELDQAIELVFGTDAF